MCIPFRRGNMTVVVYILFLLSSLEFNEACIDPTIGQLNDLSIRSPNNTSTFFVDGQGLLLSDDGLKEGWFKTTEGAWTYVMTDANMMPTIGTCSTYWPIYLEGTHPELKPFAAPVNATACLRFDGFPCGLRADIQIRKCGNELQYYLPTTIQYSAYCFSKYKSLCGDGTQAAAPTATDFGEVTVSPELYHTDVTIGAKINHKPYFLMRCGFRTQSSPDMVYVVDWYVDGRLLVSYGPANQTALDDLTLHETKIDRLGIEISCAVRAATGECGQQTDRTYSTSYYAGIKILTPVITRPTGKRGTFKMKATVPIGCNYDDSDTSSCRAPVRIFDHKTSGHACTKGSIANINTNVDNKQCSKGIESLSVGKQFDADKLFTFDIATIDETYEDKLTFILKLEFDPSIGHQKWNTFTFPDIQVRINDTSTYKKKICYSHIGPHMRSSDQHYFENQKVGEFMLYNNKRYGIEVQEKTALCNNNQAKCACAIAIRAGKDVFKINRCGTINYIGFIRCGDGGILQVVRKNDNLYEVFTPIGTKIAITLKTGKYDGFMNIDITMAPKDLGNVHGLCGKFDGVKTNDLFGRNGTTTPIGKYPHHPYTFTEGWKLRDSENLLKSPNRTLSSWAALNGVYCTCTQDGAEMVATCAPTQYLKCTKPKSITHVKCRIKERSKRNADHNNDKELNRLFALMNSESKHRIVKREDSENITAEEARDLCTNMINGSLAIRNYSEVGGDEDPDAVIENCAFDVEVGNDRSWANIHVESVNTIVKSMMEYEPTYVINNSEKVETFLVNTCPGNCSDNGNCTKSGDCSCKQYHHGATCSIDERDALIIDDIEGGGVCDLAEGDECVCFTIRSDNILDGYKCKIQTTLYFKNGTNHQTQTSIEKGEYEDIFTGVCCDNDNVRSDNEFGLVYEVSISNNGEVFSNIATVHVLNSACQEIDTDAPTPFSLKNQTCFIDGVCYLDGDWSHKQTNTCFSCQSSVESYHWTEQPCPTTTVPTTTTSSMSSISVTSTINKTTSTQISISTTTATKPNTTSGINTTLTSTPDRESSVISTIKTSTSTPTSTSTTTEANTDTSSAPSTSAPSTTSTSTTERETSVTSTINKSTSTPTSTPTTTEANTGTSSTPRTTSKSTTERETSVTSTINKSTSTPTSTPTTTEANTGTSSTASTTSTSTTERETSATSTINKSTPTSTSSTTDAKTDTSSAASTPLSSTPESGTPAPEAQTLSLGMIIGLSTGVPVIIIVIVVITVVIAIRFKKMKRSGMKGKPSGHVATHHSEKGSSMDRDNSFYVDNPLNKSYKGIPVAQSGHFNVEGYTFSMPASSQSLGDISAVTIDFKTGTD